MDPSLLDPLHTYPYQLPITYKFPPGTPEGPLHLDQINTSMQCIVYDGGLNMGFAPKEFSSLDFFNMLTC